MSTLHHILASVLTLLLIAGCAEAEKMARNAVDSRPTAASSASSSTAAVQRAGAVTAAAATDTLRYAGWNTEAGSYYVESEGQYVQSEVGDVFTYSCEPTTLPGDLANDVFGDNPYHIGSRICPAGVHAGVLVAADGGLVTIEIVEGLEEYPAVKQNDVQSKSMPGGNSFNRAFRVIVE